MAAAILAYGGWTLAQDARDPAAGGQERAAPRREGGREAGREGGPMPGGGWPREWAAAAAELDLTPEQRATLEDKMNALRAALAEWEQRNQEKIGEVRDEMRQAEQAGDREASRRAMERMRPLMAERGRIETEGQARLMDVLTADQKAAFAAVRITQDREFQALLQALNPPPELEAKLKEAAKTGGAALVKWESENGENLRKLEAQADEALAALRPLREQRDRLVAGQKAAVLAVLTPEQRTTVIAGRLQEQVLWGIGRDRVNEEQMAKIKDLCRRAVAEVSPETITDMRAMENLRGRLARDVREQVLGEPPRPDGPRPQMDAPRPPPDGPRPPPEPAGR
jgi:Spy/CpxP family protein refolding chaperone